MLKASRALSSSVPSDSGCEQTPSKHSLLSLQATASLDPQILYAFGKKRCF